MHDRAIGVLRGGGRFKVHDLFDQIISLPNLFTAWQEFKLGKTRKSDVSEFAENIEDLLFELHQILVSNKYRHGKYTSYIYRIHARLWVIHRFWTFPMLKVGYY